MGTHSSKPTFASNKPMSGSTHSPKATAGAVPLSKGSTHPAKAYGTNPRATGSRGTNNQKGGSK